MITGFGLVFGISAALVFLALYLRERRAYQKLVQRLAQLATGADRSPLSPTYLLSQVEERWRAAEERYQDLFQESLRILEGMPLGVVVLDHLNRILFANRVVQDFFHVRVERGQDLYLLFRDRTVTDRALRALDLELPEELTFPSGRVFRFWGRKGRFFRVLVIEEITDRVRLKQMREELMGNLARALQGPLAELRKALETLEGRVSEDREKQLVKAAQNQAQQLDALVRDLLELGRIEQTEPQWAFLDFTDLVAGEVRAIEEEARRRGIHLAYDHPKEAISLEGDRFFLERMVRNLLDNALRYTPSGGRVEVRVYDAEDQVVLEVSDTGLGISERDLPRIFERFYRGEVEPPEMTGGTGLGLAIVKHAAEAHGGRVEVFSKRGKGSLFRVFLPRKGRPG